MGTPTPEWGKPPIPFGIFGLHLSARIFSLHLSARIFLSPCATKRADLPTQFSVGHSLVWVNKVRNLTYKKVAHELDSLELESWPTYVYSASGVCIHMLMNY